jgi:N-methylhydantoinase B
LAPVALVCTRGFADVLTLGRQNRAELYVSHVGASPWLELVPTSYRLEVAGRIDAMGLEVEGLDASQLVGAIRALVPPPRAIVISLMFARLNPMHEETLRALLETQFDIPVLCSHTIDARDEHGNLAPGEFEQTVAALAAVGVQPPAVVASVNPAGAGNALHADLEALADVMQAVLVKEALSSVVREAMDCAAALFLPDGRLLAQARSLPLLLGSLAPAVAGLLAQFPVSAMRSGDGFVTNDPWSGGTHLPDFVVLRPVLVAGHVKALVTCVLHHQDVGGITPGSVPTNATSIHQEGMRLPPLALYQGGEINTALLRLLRANSRMPDNLEGDLKAQWSALEIGARLMTDLISAKGGEFEELAERLLLDAETSTRRALSNAADGQYHYQDALDGDGLSQDPVAIDVLLEKRGDSITIDLSGCAAQTPGPINASRGAVAAAINYFARMLSPTAPSNHGCLVPIRVVSRPGTVVDPLFPAAVNARTNLVKLLANALLGAWAKAAPEASPAPNAGVAVVLSLSGTRGGKPWLFTEIIASAAGGSPWGPGGSAVSTDVGNARNTPAQVIEMQAPIRVECLSLHATSAGAGRHAGGSGVTRRYLLLEGEGVISYRGERHQTAALGSAGGSPGGRGRATIERADGQLEVLPAKCRAAWKAGDRLVIQTAGGGGWGTASDGDQPGAQRNATALNHPINQSPGLQPIKDTHVTTI